MTKRSVARHTTELWERADAGATIYILDNGTPAYRVEKIDSAVDPLVDLFRRGLATPAKRSGMPLTPARIPAADADAAIAAFEADRARDEW